MQNSIKMRIYCDEPADRQLIIRLKSLSHVINRIPDENILLYPQISEARNNHIYSNIVPLFEHDRPDYIFEINDKPILVIEITEHAYTGDNGLQRFGRVAAAAENKTAFIYFGPLSRVRDDELDLTDDPSGLSKRSLTSDFFAGMESLHKIYGSPQLYAEWNTAPNGKVIKLPLRSSEEEFQRVYGTLVSLMDAIIIEKLSLSHNDDSRRVVQVAQDKLISLASIINTKYSDVKLQLNKNQICRLLIDARRILKHVKKEYFFKGKPDKLISLMALEDASIDVIRLGNNCITASSDIRLIKRKICALDQLRDGACAYFSGYKWRSDPHCGVAINMYYRLCCSPDSKIRRPLILFYPRISISKEKAKSLTNSERCKQRLLALFKERYGVQYKEKYTTTLGSDGSYHHWVDSTKQSRIFKKYCSLIFCNDGVIIGDSLARILQ